MPFQQHIDNSLDHHYRLLMSTIVLVDSVALFLCEASLKTNTAVACGVAAGRLLGGALLRMIPAAIENEHHEP